MGYRATVKEAVKKKFATAALGQQAPNQAEKFLIKFRNDVVPVLLSGTC
jgi:hypothetical protein